ncbi:MAG TPA: cobalamin-dependent protein [Phycisphaerales bacterium]|nr:cobalamin-dependent protein [Phycisphaerales bacterium]
MAGNVPRPPAHLPPAPPIDERRFIAQFLISESQRLGRQAARRMPASASPIALDEWSQHLAARTTDLASAVLAGEAGLFADQVQWARVAFGARNMPVQNLAASLDALRDELSHELPQADRPWPLACIAQARAALDAPAAAAPPMLSSATPHGQLAAKYLLTVLEGDRRAAGELLVQAVRAGTLTVTDCYEHVLIPVQRELGRMWHVGDLSVAEEHFATGTTTMVMSQLYPLLPRSPGNGRTVITASVEGNFHDVGARMVADYFEIAGWKSICLGASVPPEDIAQAVDHFGADLVALSASMPSHLHAVEATINAIHAVPHAKPVRVLVGGPAFSGAGEAWKEAGADGHATTAQEAVDTARKLVA